MHALQLRARDIAVAIAYRTGGKDDGIVVLLQLVHGDIAADVHVGKQANLLRVQYAVQGFNDAFNAWMVRGHAVADEAEGSGHLLNEIDVYIATGLFHQDIGGVNAGGTGTDDGYV